MGKLAGAPALHLLPFLPHFISSCTGRSGAGDRALGREGWLRAEHELVAASLLAAVAASLRLHLAPRSDQQAGAGAALSALLTGICLQAAPLPAAEPGMRAAGQGREQLIAVQLSCR